MYYIVIDRYCIKTMTIRGGGRSMTVVRVSKQEKVFVLFGFNKHWGE